MANHKFKLEGILTHRTDLSKSQQKEIASRLDLPDNSNNSRDIMFLSAILVSTGTNKNGAHFLGSELVKARQSISLKPLNIEHQEQAIIGHITEWLFLDQAGSVLDDEALFNSISMPSEKDKAAEQDLDIDLEELEKQTQVVDAMDMDIGIVCAVHRDRFPEIAEDIELGKFKVSMECYFETFDIKVGDFILPRSVAQSASSVSLSEKSIDLTLLPQIRDVASGRSMGNVAVARVLRGIHFCGVGIVENPANVRSLILEAAKQLDKKAKVASHEGMRMVASIDLQDIENQVKQICMEVSETTIHSTFAVVQDGSIISTWSEIVTAKNSAAELAFKTSQLGTKKVGAGVEQAAANYDWGLTEESTCSQGICIVEVFSRFTPAELVETSSQNYEVINGTASPLAEVMESTKVCKIVEGEELSKSQKTAEEDKPKAEEQKEESILVQEKVITKAGPAPTPSKKVNPIPVPKAPASASKEERLSLTTDQFGLRSLRRYPIHTADRVVANMEFFPHTCRKLATKQQKEFFANLIKAGLKLGINTVEFEKKSTLKFTEGKDYSATFGVPRLKKFPLDTRQQVISAMSRYTRLSLDLSEMEKEGLLINILRAAAKLGINSDAFRTRVTNS